MMTFYNSVLCGVCFCFIFVQLCNIVVLVRGRSGKRRLAAPVYIIWLAYAFADLCSLFVLAGSEIMKLLVETELNGWSDNLCTSFYPILLGYFETALGFLPALSLQLLLALYYLVVENNTLRSGGVIHLLVVFSTFAVFMGSIVICVDQLNPDKGIYYLPDGQKQEKYGPKIHEARFVLVSVWLVMLTFAVYAVILVVWVYRTMSKKMTKKMARKYRSHVAVGLMSWVATMVPILGITLLGSTAFLHYLFSVLWTFNFIASPVIQLTRNSEYQKQVHDMIGLVGLTKAAKRKRPRQQPLLEFRCAKDHKQDEDQHGTI